MGDLLVSKAHVRSVLTLDQNGLMMVETKGKDGTWNQQWEMAPAEEESDKPSGPIPKGKCLLKRMQAALDIIFFQDFSSLKINLVSNIWMDTRVMEW